MHDYWIEERKLHTWFEDVEKTESHYNVKANIDGLNQEQRDRFIKFIRELGEE